MGRSGATYWPASLLVTLRVMPVSLLVILMATLGMTDPEGSVTVPTTVASWPKAESEAPATSTARIRRERRLRCFAARGALGAPFDEKGFMCNSFKGRSPDTGGHHVRNLGSTPRPKLPSHGFVKFGLLDLE